MVGGQLVDVGVRVKEVRGMVVGEMVGLLCDSRMALVGGGRGGEEGFEEVLFGAGFLVGEFAGIFLLFHFIHIYFLFVLFLSNPDSKTPLPPSLPRIRRRSLRSFGLSFATNSEKVGCVCAYLYLCVLVFVCILCLCLCLLVYKV